MAEPITIEDALGTKAATSSRDQRITFEDALATRTANTRSVVDVERLQRAQAFHDMGQTDPEYLDPRSPGTPRNPDADIPIESYLRTEAPQLQPARGRNFGATLKASIPRDMETRRRVLAQSLFPNDPNGASRVGFVDDTPVYVDEQGQLRRVSGPWVKRGAGLLSSTPEVAGSIIGSFATLNPISGSAVGAAGGAAVKRGLSGLMLDEPLTAGGVATEMGVEGVTDAAGGLIGKGIATTLDRGRFADFTPQNLRQAEGTQSRLRQSTGIHLDLAQASGNRKLIGIRAYAARYPGKSAELIQAAEEAQQGQLDTAVRRTMDSIARASPAEVYGANGISAAKLVIEAAKVVRNQAVKPYYAAAGKVSISADVSEALNKDPVLRFFGAKVQRDPLYQRQFGIDPDARTTVRTNTTPEQRLRNDPLINQERMQPVPGGRKSKTIELPAAQQTNTVGFWHQVQQALDDEIAKSAKEPNKVRLLTQARKDLNQKLEAASPEFAEANAHYAQVTRDSIEPLENSPVGTLARITTPKAATAAARIFSDPNITAAELRATRASIASKDPEVWNGLVRQWVASRWNKALRKTQTGDEVNAAGKLRQALIGTPEDQAKMAVMLPPGAVQAFDDLMEAAQALARTPTAGSNTMRDTEIRDQLKGTALTVYRYLTSPRQSIREAGEQRVLERSTEAIAEAILDPAKRSQLKQIVRMQPGTKRAILFSSIFAAKTGKEAIGPAMDAPPDQAAQRAPVQPIGPTPLRNHLLDTSPQSAVRRSHRARGNY